MSQIDLHTHSTASDGSLTPTELVNLAAQSGLRAIALTDHDTTAGLEEAAEAGKKTGVEIIFGCELSVDFKPGTMHILGLWLPLKPARLCTFLEELRNKRHERNERIIEKIASFGHDITYDEVKAIAGDATVGRPHIAKLLIGKKIVNDGREAFENYLGPKGRAYFPKEKFTPEVAVKLLKDEGGLVILAHPHSIGLQGEELEAAVKMLMDYGLDGIEVYYSEHGDTQTRQYYDLARKHNLCVSGGSDFHGPLKPHIRLGRGKGNLNLSYDLVLDMKKRRLDMGLPV